MGDKSKGLYSKYRVERTDGKDRNPDYKYNEADYFVLDLTFDRHARKALLIYAKSCKVEYPALAADLFEKIIGWKKPNE